MEDFTKVLLDGVQREQRAARAIGTAAKLHVFHQLLARLQPLEALTHYENPVLIQRVMKNALQGLLTWASEEIRTLESHDDTRPA